MIKVTIEDFEKGDRFQREVEFIMCAFVEHNAISNLIGGDSTIEDAQESLMKLNHDFYDCYNKD